MTLELPEIAENGNTVPFTIAVDSPMTEKDHVKAIHIIATSNPQPGRGDVPALADLGQGGRGQPHAPAEDPGRHRHRRVERRPVPDDQAPRSR
jgi:hypothetical protein